ncbi:hypothetical protein Pedsa_0969 [Pseudopedobacter saltans DSM 12145]|uniref:DUF4406 domain-containing protein n=1 Tax=Pseudopedobacter saltans (strain ATCC 51119 / DSM 12145 / JCM 21818 / CCUG 39354 / LMG 10337 / NBRC 100064 / NCIMB 13643) TaxID=762903 RepID=F0SAU6_PSESL|nr:DUF4406 domain-containing protein [Pseudopedobacter saltans]ADY51541.1 hypothetical protein Pedsa_0969 [Pseudopedobacter saltans DSM 12145]
MSKVKTIKELPQLFARDGRPVAYIAGKVTGLPHEEVQMNFFKAEIKLERNNQVINPARIVHPECDWKEAMKICVSLLPKADLVVTLPNWKDSPGASWEVSIAGQLGIPVVSLDKL